MPPGSRERSNGPFHLFAKASGEATAILCLDTANRDLEAWLAQKDQRVHGTTHEVVAKRFEREQPHLKLLPQLPFDTSYRLYRKVAKDCTVRFEANSFVVPHTLVGKQIVPPCVRIDVACP